MFEAPQNCVRPGNVFARLSYKSHWGSEHIYSRLFSSRAVYSRSICNSCLHWVGLRLLCFTVDLFPVALLTVGLFTVGCFQSVVYSSSVCSGQFIVDLLAVVLFAVALLTVALFTFVMFTVGLSRVWLFRVRLFTARSGTARFVSSSVCLQLLRLLCHQVYNGTIVAVIAVYSQTVFTVAVFTSYSNSVYSQPVFTVALFTLVLVAVIAVYSQTYLLSLCLHWY